MYNTLHDVIIYGDIRAEEYIKAGKGIMITIPNAGVAFSKVGLSLNGTSIIGANGIEVIKSDVMGHGLLFKHTEDITKDTFLRATDGDAFIQKKDGTEFKLWHSGNDGAGSGLDADTLAGINASGFMKIDYKPTALGEIITLGTGDFGAIHQNNGELKQKFSIVDDVESSFAFEATSIGAPDTYRKLLDVKNSGDVSALGSVESQSGEVKLKSARIKYNEIDGCIDFSFQ
jgi:hypothetical protein